MTFAGVIMLALSNTKLFASLLPVVIGLIDALIVFLTLLNLTPFNCDTVKNSDSLLLSNFIPIYENV